MYASQNTVTAFTSPTSLRVPYFLRHLAPLWLQQFGRAERPLVSCFEADAPGTELVRFDVQMALGECEFLKRYPEFAHAAAPEYGTSAPVLL